MARMSETRAMVHMASVLPDEELVEMLALLARKGYAKDNAKPHDAKMYRIVKAEVLCRIYS